MENTLHGQFVTAFYGVVDPGERSLTFCLTGQPDSIYFQPGNLEPSFLSLDPALALGVVRDTRFPESTVPLAAGSVLVLYTDGITEALNAEGEQFGRARLARVVGAHRDAGARGICDALRDALAAHCESERPSDDVTLVAVRVLASQGA